MSDTPAVTAKPGDVKRTPERWFWQNLDGSIAEGTVHSNEGFPSHDALRRWAGKKTPGRPILIPGESDPPPVDPLAGLEWLVTGVAEEPEQRRVAVAAFDNEADAREYQEREFTMTGQVVTRTAYLASIKEKQQ